MPDARPDGGVPDRRCATLVAPFSLTSNVESLFSMGFAKVSDSIGSMLNSNAEIGSARSRREIEQSRHKVAKSVREAAIRMNWLPMDAEVYYGQIQHDKLGDQAELVATFQAFVDRLPADADAHAAGAAPGRTGGGGRMVRSGA